MKPKLNVKTGDTVVVISGANKGKSGKIKKAFPSEGKVIVEGVAMVKRHQKPRGQGMQGGIIEKEAPIQVSNVMLLCPSCKKPTRVGHKFVEVGGKQKKVRVCKKANCGAAIDN
ncbi:50S ribosomal protein L24 [Bacillota bacterium Meth-B3]|nr:50S ribosomal protein L24 [Christensenellaceae bacterium]MEA5066312.1 50S ribosomal protein L24 [Eubacteriales bacterium]MEA5068992.1 50S ribosomal protein L24 [Christensenellaceae bacterium]